METSVLLHRIDDAKKAVNEVRSAVEDFREQAPVSTFGGLIFGAL